MRSVALSLGLVLLAAAPAVAQTTATTVLTNVLANSGFENGTGLVPLRLWSRSGTGTANRSSECRTPNYAAKLGGSADVSLYQDFATGKDEVWRGTAWVKNSANDPLTGMSRAYLMICFVGEDGDGYFWSPSPRQVNASSPTNEWIQLSVAVRAPSHTPGVRFYLAYDQDGPSGGSVLFDDCQFGPGSTNVIRFANRDWVVYDWSWDSTSRTNPIEFSADNVSVDSNGWLHLPVVHRADGWTCSEVETTDSFGYGEYTYRTTGRLDLLETNTVVGLFAYDDQEWDVYHEIDVEVSKAEEAWVSNCLLYTVQPYNIPENGWKGPMDQTNTETTHRFRWTPGRVQWLSYYGDGDEPSGPGAVIGERDYISTNVPTPPLRGNLNLWLSEGDAPEGTQNLELVVKDFRFRPWVGTVLEDAFDDDARSNLWDTFGYANHEIEETDGVLRVKAGIDWETAGYVTARDVGWDFGGVEYTFSALLTTIQVDEAISGEDLGAILSFVSEKEENGYGAADAFTLQGLYDDETDDLTLRFFTKDNWAGTWGHTNFVGTVTNASGRFASGGIGMRVTLGPKAYALGFTDAGDAPIAVETNAGATSGDHGLSWRLKRGFIEIGAWNGSETNACGSVFWDRMKLSVGLPAAAAPSIGMSGPVLSWPSEYYRTYSILWSTNLQDFQPLETGLVPTPPLNRVTNELPAGASFYGIGVQDDSLQ